MRDIDTVSILGTRFNSMAVVCDRIIGSEDASRLRNWYRIDHGLCDMDNFAWGYSGQGPYELSYSILRELFGREVAERDADALHSNLISILDQNRCFLIIGTQIRIVLGIGMDGRIIRERSHRTDDTEMAGAGLYIASAVETTPGGAYEDPPLREATVESIREAFREVMDRIGKVGGWK